MKLKTYEEITNYLLDDKSDLEFIGKHLVKYKEGIYETLHDLKSGKKYKFDKIKINNGLIYCQNYNHINECIFNSDGQIVVPQEEIFRFFQIIDDNHIFIKYGGNPIDGKKNKSNYVCDKNGNIISTCVDNFAQIDKVIDGIIIGIINDPTKDLACGAIDYFGHTIIPFDNQNVYYSEANKTIVVEKKHTITTYSLSGKKLNHLKKQRERYEDLFSKNIITNNVGGHNTTKYNVHLPNGQKKKYKSYQKLSDLYALVETTKGEKRILSYNGNEKELNFSDFKEINGYYFLSKFPIAGEIEVYNNNFSYLWTFDTFCTDYTIYKDYLIIDGPDSIRIIDLVHTSNPPYNQKVYKHQVITKNNGMTLNNYPDLTNLNGYIAVDGNIVFDLNTGQEIKCPENMTYGGNGIAFAKEDSPDTPKFGFYNIQEEKYLIEPKYNSISPLKDYYIVSLEYGLYGVVDSEGKEILKPLFKRVEQVKDNYFRVDGKIVDINNVQFTYNIALYSGDELLTTKSFDDFEFFEKVHRYLEYKINEMNKKEDRFISKLHQEGISEFSYVDNNKIKILTFNPSEDNNDNNQ